MASVPARGDFQLTEDETVTSQTTPWNICTKSMCHKWGMLLTLLPPNHILQVWFYCFLSHWSLLITYKKKIFLTPLVVSRYRLELQVCVSTIIHPLSCSNSDLADNQDLIHSSTKNLDQIWSLIYILESHNCSCSNKGGPVQMKVGVRGITPFSNAIVSWLNSHFNPSSLECNPVKPTIKLLFVLVLL